MSHRALFRRLFWITFCVQIVAFAVYFAISVDSRGGETPFQGVYLSFYRPVLGIVFFIADLLIGGWAAAGFMLAAGPLIGALTYSYVFARVVAAYKRDTATSRSEQLDTPPSDNPQRPN